MDTLEKTLKTRRQSLGWSQTRLATKAGLCLATIQNIEAGTANPNLETLNSICSVLGVALELKPIKVTLDTLIPYGLPLNAETPVTAIRPHRAALTQMLEALGSNLPQKLDSREQQSLHGFLLALHDHYPDYWQSLPSSFHNWLNRQKLNGPVIKLRRLALDHLSAYL